MDVIDLQTLQDLGVVGDDDEGVVRVVVRLDAAGNGLDRVNVEAGVGLIQQGQRAGLSMSSCKISAFFFSPPEKPTFR